MGSTYRHSYANLLASQYGGKKMGVGLFKCQETARNMGQAHNQPGSLNFPLAGHPSPLYCTFDAKEPMDIPPQQGVILAQDEESVPCAS